MSLLQTAVDVHNVAIRESVATVRAACWPLAFFNPMPQPGTLKRPPVVLVHGYLGHPNMLRSLQRRLYHEGFPQVERVQYASTRLSLPEIVQAIDAVVRPLADAHGPVDLVAHSLGAVSSRAYIKLYGGAPYIRRFVSLGGPHAGTSLYRLTPPSIRAVLDPAGPWVAKLQDGIEPVPTTVVRSAYDHQVFPPVRASLTGVREVVLTGHGHNGLLWAAEAHEAVLDALTRPSAPQDAPASH